MSSSLKATRLHARNPSTAAPLGATGAQCLWWPTVVNTPRRLQVKVRHWILTRRHWILTSCAFAVLLICADVVQPQSGKDTSPQTGNDASQSHNLAADFHEPPTPPSCINQQLPIVNMLVLGDSILWGQGLAEQNKISYKVQEWLCKETGRPVKVWREAHSGAVIKEGEPAVIKEGEPTESQHAADTKNEVFRELDGEINVGRPTIREQLSHSLSRFKGPEVDLVLMDGCINDFNFVNLLDPDKPLDQIENRTKAVCYQRMKPLLDEVAQSFPNARIIVTGYYPIITEKSARNVFYRFAVGQMFAREKQKWLFKDSKKQSFKKLVAASRQWAESSNTWLRRSVDEANENAGQRIKFAPTNYQPDAGFGSIGSGFAAPKKTSLLWTSRLSSTGRGGISKFLYVLFVLRLRLLRPNDEVYAHRKQVCGALGLSSREERTCQFAAYGHPNRMGVQEYVESISTQLRGFVQSSDWLRAKPASAEMR